MAKYLRLEEACKLARVNRKTAWIYRKSDDSWKNHVKADCRHEEVGKGETLIKFTPGFVDWLKRKKAQRIKEGRRKVAISRAQYNKDRITKYNAFHTKEDERQVRKHLRKLGMDV